MLLIKPEDRMQWCQGSRVYHTHHIYQLDGRGMNLCPTTMAIAVEERDEASSPSQASSPQLDLFQEDEGPHLTPGA